jgi:hypothetical protein
MMLRKRARTAALTGRPPVVFALTAVESPPQTTAAPITAASAQRLALSILTSYSPTTANSGSDNALLARRRCRSARQHSSDARFGTRLRASVLVGLARSCFVSMKEGGLSTGCVLVGRSSRF